VFVLLKSNGASLYSTKDIALAELKKKEYTFDKSLYIVATEQIHHFNQLFKTLELIGYE
jgi:arginyl-tRNA synthetase